MRIIAGEFRSRRLESPRDDSVTRPIPDRVKESLFSLLRGHCEGATVFDAFAGSGAIGLEALSRGAARCVFVERHREIAELLRANIQTLGVQDRAEVFVGDALGAGAISRCPQPVHLVFVDPPYALVEEPVGWRRVSAMMEQLIARLDGTGFACLRTPWPLFHRPSTPIGAPGSAGTIDAEPPSSKTQIDLRIQGGVGPETHVYGSMAVHLYMKTPEVSASDPP